MVADRRTGAQQGEARDRTDGRTRARMVVGLAAVLVIVLAGLALLDSFTVEYAPGPPDAEPGGEDEGTPSESGGDGPSCERFERSFFWIFVGLAVAAAALFGVAVARRAHHGGRIGSSLWGILSIVTLFLAIMAFGGWRIMQALCEGALTCGSANDGTYTSFVLLLVLTLVALGVGIALAHRTRRDFLGTGWGLLGLLLYLPTVLTGFAWFLIRTFCTPDLSCATRDAFLADLSTIFWLSLLGGVLTTAIGIFVQKRFGHGFFRSGWGIVAILLGLLALLAGSGWLFVDGLTIPGCDPIETPEEPEEPPTCEELRDDIQGRLGTAFLLVGLVTAGSGIAGFVVHRQDPKRFWSSPWAIVAYVGLALLVLIGLGYLLAGSMCGEGEDGQRGDGDDRGTDSGRDGSGSGETGSGSGSGGTGGGGGGGTGSGPGGGGGTTGDSPALKPVSIDPSALTWLLIALLVVIGIATLFVLLRFRRDKEQAGAGAAPPNPDEVRARERQDLLALLGSGRLATDEAVIASYRAFVAWAAARGLGLTATETSREHAERVGKRYAIPAESMRAFIRAYEVARLSQHRPSADERDAAVRFAQDLTEARPTPSKEERP